MTASDDGNETAVLRPTCASFSRARQPHIDPDQ
jgi:hypothetical protein